MGHRYQALVVYRQYGPNPQTSVPRKQSLQQLDSGSCTATASDMLIASSAVHPVLSINIPILAFGWLHHLHVTSRPYVL